MVTSDIKQQYAQMREIPLIQAVQYGIYRLDEVTIGDLKYLKDPKTFLKTNYNDSTDKKTKRNTTPIAGKT